MYKIFVLKEEEGMLTLAFGRKGGRGCRIFLDTLLSLGISEAEVASKEFEVSEEVFRKILKRASSLLL